MVKTPKNAFFPVKIESPADVIQFMAEGMGATEDWTLPEPINHIPYVDIYSTPAEVVVDVEMPGIRPEEIEVTLFKNTLNVKAIKYECFEDSKINYVCMERSFGRIFRSVEVPFPVNRAEIKAVYRNGILKIRMPRVEEKRGKPVRIEITKSEETDG